MSRNGGVEVRAAPAVVVGSGAAGLACALALAPMPVVVVTKTAEAASGSSPLAQGGIAVAWGPADSPAQHADDTLAAGAGLSEPGAVDDLVHGGPRELRALIAAGLPFDRDAGGELLLGREAAHGRARILHAGGDATGRNLVTTLLARAARTPSIELLSETLAVELALERGQIAGLLAYRQDSGWIFFRSSNVVLASGGPGALWSETTNPPEATGDGLALAARAGAQLADLEFVQFHPTALRPVGAAGGASLPLLTEALRGAGARLIDRDGAPVMRDVHPLGDLAPRDVVARAIWRRHAAGDPVFLDLRPALAAGGEGAFPQALALCRAAGYDPFAEPVPVTPAAHYHMGGIRTDGAGRASIPGLWACGEAAANGLHGANRLASNSLLEALVFARRVAEAMTEREPPSGSVSPPLVPAVARDTFAAMRDEVRSQMSRHVGIVRHAPGLMAAAAALESLQVRFEAAGRAVADERPAFEHLKAWAELRNMLLAARLIALAAMRRTESRGAHFRRDVPEEKDEWLRHQVLTSDDLAETSHPSPPGWGERDVQAWCGESRSLAGAG